MFPFLGGAGLSNSGTRNGLCKSALSIQYMNLKPAEPSVTCQASSVRACRHSHESEEHPRQPERSTRISTTLPPCNRDKLSHRNECTPPRFRISIVPWEPGRCRLIPDSSYPITAKDKPHERNRHRTTVSIDAHLCLDTPKAAQFFVPSLPPLGNETDRGRADVSVSTGCRVGLARSLRISIPLLDQPVVELL